METFDLVVVGTGSAGTAAAQRCRLAGWSVAIVIREPFGGTCALRGCAPKKIFAGAAELVDLGRSRVAIGQTEVEAKHIVIATGTKPAPQHIEGEELLATSAG